MGIKAATELNNTLKFQLHEGGVTPLRGGSLGVSQNPPHLPHHGIYIHIWQEPRIMFVDTVELSQFNWLYRDL